MKKNKIKNKLDAFLWVFYVIILLYVLSMLFILLSGALNTFKGFGDFFNNDYFGFPKYDSNPLKDWKGFTFDNYASVFNTFYMKDSSQRKVFLPELFLNTIVFSFMMSIFSIATQVMTSYAVAKYRFKLRAIIYSLAIIVMLVPIVGALPSQIYFAYDVFKIKNNVIGISIMNCKYPGLYFLVFYAAFKSVPWTYAEAAQIDGASNTSIFFKIMLPMISSTIFAVFILYFIQFWNDYQTPMIFLPDYPTVSYALYELSQSVESGVNSLVVLTAAFVSCVPVIVLFAIFKNKIMGNVAVGGIKG